VKTALPYGRNRSGIGPNPDRGRGRFGGVSLDCTFLRGYAKNPKTVRVAIRLAATHTKAEIQKAFDAEMEG
jgi:hypothetical protein